MGAWGFGLFQSDTDLDILDDLSSEVGCNLYLAGMTKESDDTATEGKNENVVDQEDDEFERSIKSLEESRNIINPIFTQTFNDCRKQGRYVTMIFSAACMRIGVDIGDQQMAYIKANYTRTHLMPDALTQMREACEQYKNGEPWEFNSRGLEETAYATMEGEETPWLAKKETKQAENEDAGANENEVSGVAETTNTTTARAEQGKANEGSMNASVAGGAAK